MSDFGSIISIKKKERESFTDKEVEEIYAVCERLKKETKLCNSFSDPYLFKVGKTISMDGNQCFTVNILLSDHWGDATDFQWHEEVEAKDMELIASSIRPLLSEEYSLQSKYEWW